MAARWHVRPVSLFAHMVGCLAVSALLLALAAPPAVGLVLCREQDGSVAVEARLGSGCCDTMPARDGIGDLIASRGDCSGCVDTVLVLVAAPPRHAADACPGCAAVTAAPSQGDDARRTLAEVRPGWAKRSPSAPHLRVLRSVLLLI